MMRSTFFGLRFGCRAAVMLLAVAGAGSTYGREGPAPQLPGPVAAPTPAGAEPGASAAPVVQRRLAVTVTGGGRVVPDAELLFRADGMADKKLHTDERGQASWSPPSQLQRLKLRVIASGWKTHHVDVPLTAPAAQSQALMVSLEADPPTPPPPGR